MLDGSANYAGGIGRRDFDGAPLQVLEVNLGVLPLVLGRLQKDRRDLLEAFVLRDAREVGIAVTCLTLTSKSLEKILFRACAL